jgi:hypothetical protein
MFTKSFVCGDAFQLDPQKETRFVSREFTKQFCSVFEEPCTMKITLVCLFFFICHTTKQVKNSINNIQVSGEQN